MTTYVATVVETVTYTVQVTKSDEITRASLKKILPSLPSIQTEILPEGSVVTSIEVHDQSIMIEETP